MAGEDGGRSASYILASTRSNALPHVAAVLAAVLAKIHRKADIPAALASYQMLRKPRADWAVESARITGANLHLPDGPEQQLRDRMLASSTNGGSARNPDRWGDK